MKSLFLGVVGAVALLGASPIMAQSVKDVVGPMIAEQIHGEQPPAKLLVDPPVPEHLEHGRVIIQYRAENLRILPAFGPHAAQIIPRVGHIHVTVDDNPWRWADASGLPLIVNGLPKGPHHIRIDLETPLHQTIDSQTVEFVIP